MTKKELIEMLSDVPDNSQILLTCDVYNLISNTQVHTVDIKGFYEFRGSFVLTAANVRPGPFKKDD